jgi:hypothetical protein
MLAMLIISTPLIAYLIGVEVGSWIGAKVAARHGGDQ